MYKRIQSPLPAAVLLALAALVGCSKPEGEPAETAPASVTSITVEPSALDVTETLPGRVAAFRVAEIRPQVGGIVQQRLFEQGSDVKAGQPLFRINPQPFQAEAQSAAAALQRAVAARDRAGLQVDRLKVLVKEDAVSQQAYDDAAAQHSQAVADVAQAKATLERRRLDVEFSTVRAPISGRIDQELITEGALVAAADANPMARIQQIDRVYVDVRRPAASIEALRNAARAGAADDGIPVKLLRGDGTAYGAQGKILFSGISVDPQTGDALVRVLVDNPQAELLPGMYIQAALPKVSYAGALMVPQQAVVRSGGQTHVWTVDEGGIAHLALVGLAELNDGRYRIRHGLKAGQKVVVQGMERLAEDMPVTTEAPQVSADAPAKPAAH